MTDWLHRLHELWLPLSYDEMVTTGTLMKHNMNLTQTERTVLDKARHLFSAYLATFLLSGLGGTDITHCRAFTAHSSFPLDDALTFRFPGHNTAHHAAPLGEEVTYRFEIRNDPAHGLPSDRDPLVLAVLLFLLVELRLRDDTARFTMSEIIERLQWSQPTKSRLLMTQAIEKYLSTAYCLFDSSVAEAERSQSFHLRFKRLLIAYQTTSELPAAKGRDAQRQIRVQFPSAFVNAIILSRKHFLSLEFQTLREMQEIPC